MTRREWTMDYAAGWDAGVAAMREAAARQCEVLADGHKEAAQRIANHRNEYIASDFACRECAQAIREYAQPEDAP
jgi:hypothetical protein